MDFIAQIQAWPISGVNYCTLHNIWYLTTGAHSHNKASQAERLGVCTKPETWHTVCNTGLPLNKIVPHVFFGSHMAKPIISSNTDCQDCISGAHLTNMMHSPPIKQDQQKWYFRFCKQILTNSNSSPLNRRSQTQDHFWDGKVDAYLGTVPSSSFRIVHYMLVRPTVIIPTKVRFSQATGTHSLGFCTHPKASTPRIPLLVAATQ